MAGEKPPAARPAGAGGQVAGGTRLWLALYKGSNGNGQATAIAASPDGSQVFVTGSSATTTGGFAYATVAYDAATGARRWVARYFGPARESAAVQLVVSPDGSEVFATGSAVKVFRNLGQYQYATLAYDAATGARRWLRLYPDRARYSPGVGIAVSADESKVFVTGTRAKPGFHYATVAYSS